jgi:hypothetical protein
VERNLIAKEINDLIYSRQYFWRQPVMPPTVYGKRFSYADKERMIKQIQADCSTELARWKGRIETNPGMYDIVKQYWVEGVGLSPSEVSKEIEERKNHIINKIKGETPHPWSAAFVSFIMRKAYPDFRKSRAHNRYIQWAKENRDTDAHPFQAFRIEEVSVGPGDIICFARSTKNWATYENVKGKLTHGDIVISVENGYAVTIGGNVNKNVEEKKYKYKLDSYGYLEQEYVTINNKSLPKYIAIIKLLPYKKVYPQEPYDDGISLNKRNITDFEIVTLPKGKFHGFLSEKSYLREGDLSTKIKVNGYPSYFEKGDKVELLMERQNGDEKWVKVGGLRVAFNHSNGDTYYHSEEKEGRIIPRVGWIKKAWVKDTSSTSSISTSASLDCKSAEWDKVKRSFTKVHWDFTPDRKKDETDEDYEKRKTEFKEKIHGVLKRSGVDPIDWFNSFTHITFLGVKFNHPIHIELATHLTLVENEFARKYGGSNSSPKEAGRVLGIKESLKGGRKESTTAGISTHTVGLALDVEYTNNPYLGGTEYSYSDDLKKAIYIIDNPPTKKPKKWRVLNVIFKRAGILIYGKEAAYPINHSYKTRLTLYDELKVLNALTIKYFNLVDNPTELTSLISTNNVNEWKGKTVDEATSIINKDYDWFRGLVSRYWKVQPDIRKGIKGVQSHAIKDVGFLNLDRRFVDELGLDWGATYGDMMHFDMRNKCIGKIIDENR